MALFQGNFFSKSLLTNVNVWVILPLPDCDDINQGLDKNYNKNTRFQTLYLLHGAFGDCMDWVRNTRIECYAQQNRVAVVMASAINGFYIDQENGPAFEQFFAEELVEFAEMIYPLSSKKEDRFAAGLSMGGYGALRLALRHPDTFGAAVSFSGAFNLEAVGEYLESLHARGPQIWGTITRMPKEKWDIVGLAKEALKSDVKLPDLMLSCGTEDYTLEVNRKMKADLEELGIVLTYEEHPGMHNWDYWETHIQRALAWLPLRRCY